MVERTCENCKYETNGLKSEPCRSCVHNATECFTPMSNADRIRNMSDEELAEFICGVNNNTTRFAMCDASCEICPNDDEVCIELITKWLEDNRLESD